MKMFLDDELIEHDTLRQGDIVSDVHLLGVINSMGIQYSSQAGRLEEFISWSVPAAPKFGDAMVLSHSCEVDRENTIKVTSIILAPLRNINTATDKNRIKELIESNLIDQTETNASFLKYFYVGPNSQLEYGDGAVVDFSKCFSVRNKCYDIFLANKKIQLAEDAVASMALKLALYFYRKNTS